MIKNISVIGAGSWGTALSEVLSRAGKNVTLFARDADLAKIMTVSHENTVYLPGINIDPRIKITADIAEAVKGAELVLLVTPAQFVRNTCLRLKPHLAAGVALVNCSKGIEAGTGKLISEVVAEVLPGHPYAALSGPTFASEVVRGLPSAVTLATVAADACVTVWADAIRGKMLRPYKSDDPVGVECAGAIKNVIAIACGIVEGRALGQNARAAIMTRGIAEIRRFGMKRGAKAETFLGLSGIGDLALTCNSMTSRNFSLGYELGTGKLLEDILKSRKTVAEGVATARAVAADAEKNKIDMPISLAIDNILHHGHKVEDVIFTLLSRDLKNEVD